MQIVLNTPVTSNGLCKSSHIALNTENVVSVFDAHHTCDSSLRLHHANTFQACPVLGTDQILCIAHRPIFSSLSASAQSVPLVAAAGRSRWKTENENHNLLKTKGYHLEHNFGHGQNHLAACLLTLNLLAFLFHTVLQLTDTDYQHIRQKRGTRKGFFQDILSLTKYLLFDSWQSLIEFMLYGSTPIQTPNSS
jgi:hypothetical protein